MARKPYTIVGIYDTETTTLKLDGEWCAFPCLYIYNDVTGCDLRNYTEEMGKVSYLRTLPEMLDVIYEAVQSGEGNGYIPIICAYNLMFDLQPLMYELSQCYDMEINAQSGTNVYTLDLVEDGATVLRFWDTYHLETRGLKAMGDACGLKKAYGDWDYGLVRHDETPLTEREKYYAACDVQIIPKYLSHLMRIYEWLTPEMLGVKVITKTSLVRCMAYETFANLRIKTKTHKSISLERLHVNQCKEEAPKTYESYCLRKSCFRGGFTFTSANRAMQVHKDACSIDAVSMHHTFINGRYVPVRFEQVPAKYMQNACEVITRTTLQEVLKSYHKPFPLAVHAYVCFDNIRLKHGTVFERDGIGLLASSKFSSSVSDAPLWGENEAASEVERYLKAQGYHDRANEPVFAFSKLMQAKQACVFVNEIELWNIAQVYDYDDMIVIGGELSCKFVKPPDYVVLQSNLLYETKRQAKKLVNGYTDGVPYTEQLPELLPKNMGEEMKQGTASKQLLNQWYTQSIKGMFNSIYGTQAQDVFKPSFFYDDENGCVSSNAFSEQVFEETELHNCRAWYNYGMRIVGGSRMHLVIALMLLDTKLDITVLSGDTDSIKFCPKGASDVEIKEALKPLEDACDKSISYCLRRVHRDFPRYASDMKDVGHFDIEYTDSGMTHAYQYDGWNKCRINLDYDGSVHVTCAGLSRPKGLYNIVEWFEDMLKAGYDFGFLCDKVFGFNTVIDNSICHSLERTHPRFDSCVETDVTDYLGTTKRVKAPASIALYDANRTLNDMSKNSVMQNLRYMRRILPDLDLSGKIIGHKNRPYIYVDDEWTGGKYLYG